MKYLLLPIFLLAFTLLSQLGQSQSEIASIKTSTFDREEYKNWKFFSRPNNKILGLASKGWFGQDSFDSPNFSDGTSYLASDLHVTLFNESGEIENTVLHDRKSESVKNYSFKDPIEFNNEVYIVAFNDFEKTKENTINFLQVLEDGSLNMVMSKVINSKLPNLQPYSAIQVSENGKFIVVSINDARSFLVFDETLGFIGEGIIDHPDMKIGTIINVKGLTIDNEGSVGFFLAIQKNRPDGVVVTKLSKTVCLAGTFHTKTGRTNYEIINQHLEGDFLEMNPSTMFSLNESEFGLFIDGRKILAIDKPTGKVIREIPVDIQGTLQKYPLEEHLDIYFGKISSIGEGKFLGIAEVHTDQGATYLGIADSPKSCDIVYIFDQQGKILEHKPLTMLRLDDNNEHWESDPILKNNNLYIYNFKEDKEIEKVKSGKSLHADMGKRSYELERDCMVRYSISTNTLDIINYPTGAELSKLFNRVITADDGSLLAVCHYAKETVEFTFLIIP